MAEIEKKPVKITETILRDAHQSLIATRMTTEQMLPIIDKMDKVGYHAVECWGGATFDASLRFLKEDPWDRLRKFRDGFKNTKLQMLFRGQNILGYRPYADDVVEYFVQKSVANGIDIIRIFDCLNDMRNLQTAVKAANKEKGTCTGCTVLYIGRCLYSGLLDGSGKEDRGYGCRFYLCQGYGWSALSRIRQQSLVTASERSSRHSDRDAYTLYFRCGFHDLSEVCRGRC